MTHSPYGRGICSVCNREMNLLKNGTLRHHSGPGLGYLTPSAYRCKGAGKAPAARTQNSPA